MGQILRLLMMLPSMGSRAYGTLAGYFRSHPVLATVFATGGVQGVIELAAAGDTTAIQALSEAASLAGVAGDPGTMPTTGLSIGSSLSKISDSVSSFFSDEDIIEVSPSEFDKIEAMKELATFIRGNISGDVRTVLRYHSMMKEFIDMKPENVERLCGAFL